MMRSFDYARTAPEPPEGALVFAVALVEIVMARTYAAALSRRQRVLASSGAATGADEPIIADLRRQEARGSPPSGRCHS